MKRRFLSLSLPVFILILSCSKPQNEVITRQNVREVLTRYGQANPENEVLIETDFGNMRIRLYDETPLHRANFIKLIKEGHYEEAEFYRVFYQFMIQGGDFDDQLDYMIPAEFNKKYIHKKGALSMARQDEDNPDLQSSSTEFFIVHGGKYADYQVDEEVKNLGLTLTPEQRETYMTSGGYMSLDQKYTVFGEVVEGLDVIDKIASVKVYQEDKPLKKIPLRISVVGSRQ
ncbi:peptidylprolyl isomerase [Fulvivirgaceae bacterium PWU4]|uniref:Peptidyl-prolyl cis-trans isomerase n=1 Tax=Chryseosolibacter histidini TaxID=2782349 RepID=A0AAP2DTF3_9BACT|nr:peptidylprolyl isomerase [Chryseosolibacter histidini]MBT1701008.1 peptidylprolyl isomerase [Chryseosolibacter histidini]